MRFGRAWSGSMSNWLVNPQRSDEERVTFSMQPEDDRRRPLVSIIVPSYNYGHVISQTLISIQSQTYENWECLVVDDGSTDNTSAIVASFSNDSRIRVIRQDNKGLAAARNAG